MSERNVDLDKRLEQLANSYSELSDKSLEEAIHVINNNEDANATPFQETKYSAVRVIMTFIICLCVDFIVYGLVATIAAIIIYYLAKVPILRILLISTIGVDFCLESFSMFVSLSVAYKVLEKMLPSAYKQQYKCIFAYSLIAILFGALNFFPSFIKGFSADSRTIGLIQLIVGILLFRHSRSEMYKYKM